MIKKYINWIITIALIVGGYGIYHLLTNNIEPSMTVHISADYPHYTSIGDLASRSSNIVRGIILDERVEMLNIRLEPANSLEETGGDFQEGEGYFATTIYRFEILESYKGDSVPGDIIEIKQMGGEYGNLSFISDDFVSFSINDDLILFLNEFGTLMSPIQSAFYYNSETRARAGGFESVDPNNTLTLTQFDLDDIRDMFE